MDKMEKHISPMIRFESTPSGNNQSEDLVKDFCCAANPQDLIKKVCQRIAKEIPQSESVYFQYVPGEKAINKSYAEPEAVLGGQKIRWLIPSEHSQSKTKLYQFFFNINENEALKAFLKEANKSGTQLKEDLPWLFLPFFTGNIPQGILAVRDPQSTNLSTNKVEKIYQLATLAFEKSFFQYMYDTCKIRDEDTELYTENYFKYQLQQEIVRAFRYAQAVSLVALRFDQFSKIKKFSEDKKFMAETELALWLKDQFRASDYLSYFSNGLFFLMFPTTTLGNAERKILMVQSKFASEFHRKIKELDKCSLSCVLGEFPTHGDRSEKLLAALQTHLTGNFMNEGAIQILNKPVGYAAPFKPQHLQSRRFGKI